MRFFILDTNVLLWWLTDNEQLGHRSKNLIADSNNSVFVSVTTIWELSGMIAKGAIVGMNNLQQLIEDEGFEVLSVDGHHSQLAGELHGVEVLKSLLVAQTQAEAATLITADSSYKKYGIRTLNATQ